jgi:ferredoxin, 2Fe-2S
MIAAPDWCACSWLLPSVRFGYNLNIDYHCEVNMGVAITFDPSGISGAVATGTYLIDAARRLGAPLGTGCTRGKADCATCLLHVSIGADLLSSPSAIEHTVIGAEQLDQGFRLACQAKIEGSGEVIVRAVARKPKENVADLDAEVRKEFVQLPLQKKIATLLQLEAITMTEALNAAIDKPLAFGSRAFDKLAGWSSKPANQQKK